MGRLSVWISAGGLSSAICSFIVVSPASMRLIFMMYDGKDIRSERLTDRKHELRRLLTGLPTSRLRYADHVEREGIALFKRVRDGS